MVGVLADWKPLAHTHSFVDEDVWDEDSEYIELLAKEVCNVGCIPTIPILIGWRLGRSFAGESK